MNSQEMIAQIAAQKLGPAPQQAASQPAPAAAPQPVAAKADANPTTMEKAQAKVAPTDQSKQSAEVPINFVKVGDREYTEDQLRGTLGRYRDLNYKWQTHKPTIDVISQFAEAARKSGHDPKPEELAKLVDSAVRAYIKNPQIGNAKPRQGSESGLAKSPMGVGEDEQGKSSFGDLDEVYEKWERENAVKLPPGLKESVHTSRAMSAKLDKMMQLFQTMMQGGMGGQLERNQAGAMQQQAQQMLQQSQKTQSDAALQMVSNNLNQAFATTGLQADPQTRIDFRLFASQRGYDFADFLDPELAKMLAADYKANKDAPEVARLRELAQKRQAFTGMASNSPTAPAAAPVADPMLQNLINKAMTRN